MAERGVGSPCTLRAYRWDGPDPVEGDFLRTAAGSCYRIDSAKRAGPRAVRTLWVLRCTRLGKDAVQFGEPGVSRWEFASRS